MRLMRRVQHIAEKLKIQLGIPPAEMSAIKCCVILGSVISAESLGVNSVLTQVSLNTWLSRGDATLFHGYFNYGDLFTLSWHLRLLYALGLARKSDPSEALWVGN